MLRCVDYSIGRDNSSRNGDGFSRIDTGTALGHAAFMAVRGQTLPSTGRSVLPPNSVLKGVNQWLLQTVTAMANISLTVEVVRLDSAAYYGVDRNKEIMEAFLTHGYDCGACCPPLDCHRRVLTLSALLSTAHEAVRPGGGAPVRVHGCAEPEQARQ